MEELAAAGVIPPVVFFDLDLANMYGAIEWPHIREAVGRYFKGAEAWLQWAHA